MIMCPSSSFQLNCCVTKESIDVFQIHRHYILRLMPKNSIKGFDVRIMNVSLIVAADPPLCLCSVCEILHQNLPSNCDAQSYLRNSHPILLILENLRCQVQQRHSQHSRPIELTAAAVAFPLPSWLCNSFQYTGQK